MKHKWITHERALLLAMAALLLCSQLPVRMLRPVTAMPSLILATVTQPFTDHLHQASTRVVGDETSPEAARDMEQMQRNYERLLQDNEWLRQKLAEARQSIVEISQTRQIIDKNERRLVSATVTAVQGERDAPVLTIALEANHGVEAGNIVGNGYNLVGRVTDVWQRAAFVSTITRPGQSLLVNLRSETAVTSEAGVHALVQADEQGRRFLTEVGVNDPVRVGDLAFLADDTWPEEARGFVVGRIVSAEPKSIDPQLRRSVVIEPVRDLRLVRRVFVVAPLHSDGER